MALADEVAGRLINMRFVVRLSPVEPGKIGATDRGVEVGELLIREVMEQLKKRAEAEGFRVEMDADQVVY